MKKDKDLIKQIKAGSADSLEELTNRYYDKIFTYSYRVLGSYHDASDVTQDVFVSMMKALPNYRERNKFSSWLFTIAHNKCMNCIAVRKNHQEIDETIEVLSSGDFTDNYADKEYVKNILGVLPENQKETLILKYYHGFTSKEIGEITNANTSTVKSRLYQGINKLRELIKDGEKFEKK